MSEALILESVNPQYDERLFIKFPEKYKFRTCCVQILFWMTKQKQKNNFCTQHVLSLYFSCNSMNNVSSYWGLTDEEWGLLKKIFLYYWFIWAVKELKISILRILTNFIDVTDCFDKKIKKYLWQKISLIEIWNFLLDDLVNIVRQ